jgi:hypothetical protein
MASCGKPFGRGLLASTWVFLVLAATGKSLWEHVVNLRCQSRCHVASELLLFTLILLDQATLVGLGHVFATLASDFMNRPQNNFFGGASARASVSGEIANIAARDIGRTVDGKGHTVRDLALPSFGVQARLIPGALARINVDPSSLVFRVHFGPDIILGIPDPTDTGSDCAAEHAKAVGPFANSATSRLQQLPHIGIPRESLVGGAISIGTTVQLNSGCATGGLIGGRRRHALGDRGH